ncbi:MAG: hypothetical protein JW726_05585 [Anaerolineales bacterium]|nr:hypothetical protein [Anaerolineales bacterium]
MVKRMEKNLESPRKQKLLDSLAWQGQENDCGPYTTATVLNALRGLNIDAVKLAADMEKIAWRGPFPVVRRIPNSATFPWGMVDVFRRNGMKASWRFFSTPEYLQEHLDKDRILMPIIGSLRPMWAHVMALVAWDAENGWGFANTQFNHHDITWLEDAKFQKEWKAIGRLLVEVKTSGD